MHFQAFGKYVLTTRKVRPSPCSPSGSVDARRKGSNRKNAKDVALQFREACEDTRSVREDAARIVKRGQGPRAVPRLRLRFETCFAKYFSGPPKIFTGEGLPVGEKCVILHADYYQAGLKTCKSACWFRGSLAGLRTFQACRSRFLII